MFWWVENFQLSGMLPWYTFLDFLTLWTHRVVCRPSLTVTLLSCWGSPSCCVRTHFLLPGQPRRIPVEPTFSLIYLRWSGFEHLNRPSGYLIKCMNLLFTNESFNKLCSDCSVALFYFKVVQFILVFNFLSYYLVTKNYTIHLSELRWLKRNNINGSRKECV